MRRIGKKAFVGHDFTARGGRKVKFRKAISKALKNSPYGPVYSDIGRLHANLLRDITKKIRESDWCIFDLTGYKEKNKLGKNLNAILELGISIGLGKQVFIAYKKGSIEFEKELSDLLGEYRHPYKSYKELSEQLKAELKASKESAKEPKTHTKGRQ